MINLYQQSLDDLVALMRDWQYPIYRAQQLYTWLYTHRVSNVDAMTNLPKDLRAILKRETSFGTLAMVTQQVSSDGTVKRLYQLADQQLIESVLMPYHDQRRTACISSQAGCAMGCVFCATGQMGFGRNLSTTEIFEQAMYFARELADQDQRLSNVVFMGMGEPFHNYDAIIASIHRLIDDLGIGQRHITVSTVGLVPQIRRFADEGLQCTLAISLHKSDDAARTALMPINKRWNLQELIRACDYYVNRTNRRITFEWAAIAGENDTPQEAHQLGQLLTGLRCHVNIIPLNPTGGYRGKPADQSAIAQFIDILKSYGVSATIRVRRGIDIDAGCGQLKSRTIGLDQISISE